MTDEGAAQPVFEPPAPGKPDAKTRRNAIIQGVVALVIVVFIFGFVLPQVIDYRVVWEVLKDLEWFEILALIVAGLITYIPEGWLYSILVPGIGLRRGIVAWVGSTAVASTIPAMDLVVRFGMYRSWGQSAESSMLGILLSGVFDNLVKFSLPVIAVLGIALGGFGMIDEGLVLVALIALVILVGTVIVVVGVVRSEAFTRGLGGYIQRIANWGLRLFKQDELTDLADRVVGFRDAGIGLVRRVWWKALTASALGKLWTYVILLLSLAAVGLLGTETSAQEGTISPRDAFIVWAIVLLLGSIPLTPGGIGFVEFGFIFLFTRLIGDQYANEIGAAVALYRLVTWAMPIPIGWGVVFWWRRQINAGKLPDPYGLDSLEAA